MTESRSAAGFAQTCSRGLPLLKKPGLDTSDCLFIGQCRMLPSCRKCVPDRQTDRQIDRQTANLISPSLQWGDDKTLLYVQRSCRKRRRSTRLSTRSWMRHSRSSPASKRHARALLNISPWSFLSPATVQGYSRIA